MNATELRLLTEASKLLARTEYRKDAARLNAIITMEGGDTLTLAATAEADARELPDKPVLLGTPDRKITRPPI